MDLGSFTMLRCYADCDVHQVPVPTQCLANETCDHSIATGGESLDH